MPTVNNATGVYATLGYNFDDPNGDIKNFSANSQSHLSAMPAFISAWQAQDIVNNDVGGYFQNPTAPYVNTIINTANSIVSLIQSSNNGISGLETVYTDANTLVTTAQSFLAHTDRLSGVTPWSGDNTVPYYQSALNFGKTAVYITNQTDGIINTSPILGSFTSILVVPQISNDANTVALSNTVIMNSLTSGTDEGGNTTFTTSLTTSQINQIQSDLANTTVLLSTRQNADVTYFNNLKNFVNKFNEVRQFSNLGETGEDLINNYIGTDKLKRNLAIDSLSNVPYTPSSNTSNGSSGGVTQNISDVINSILSESSAAYVKANNASNLANSFGVQINSAYAQSNTSYIVAQAAFDKANTSSLFNVDQFARTVANSSYNFANTILIYTQSAYSKANADGTLAQAAFDKANTGTSSSTDQYARDTANLSYSKANSSNVLAQAAFDSGNTTLIYAQSAYNRANSSSINLQNSLVLSNTTQSPHGVFNTGALVVGGGVGINGNLNVGNSTYLNGDAQVGGVLSTLGNFAVGRSYLSQTGSPSVAHIWGGNLKLDGNQTLVWDGTFPTHIQGQSGTDGYVEINAGNSQNPLRVEYNGLTRVQGTQASTSNSTGALIVSGGVGITGNVYATGNIYSNGKNLVTISQPAFDKANAAFNYANTISGGSAIDNVARTTAQAAFDYANNTLIYAESAYSYGNINFIYTQSAYDQANLAYNQANTVQYAYDQANTGTVLAQSAYHYANTIIGGSSSSVKILSSTTAYNQPPYPSNPYFQLELWEWYGALQSPVPIISIPQAVGDNEWVFGIQADNNSNLGIGYGAGQGWYDAASDTNHSIAIGWNAADGSYQGNYAIAIGVDDVGHSQSDNSIAIGTSAGWGDGRSLGVNQIAIGKNASYSDGYDNSIVLNATGVDLSSYTSGLYIKPIRNETSAPYGLYYDPDTGEVTYTTPSTAARTGNYSELLVAGSGGDTYLTLSQVGSVIQLFGGNAYLPLYSTNGDNFVFTNNGGTDAFIDTNGIGNIYHGSIYNSSRITLHNGETLQLTSSGSGDWIITGGTVVNRLVNQTSFVNFSISESAGKLYFYYSGNAVASMDSTGNFTTLGDINTFNTP